MKGNFPRWSDLLDRLIDQTVQQGVWTQPKADAVRIAFAGDYASLEETLAMLDVIETRSASGASTARRSPPSSGPGTRRPATRTARSWSWGSICS